MAEKSSKAWQYELGFDNSFVVLGDGFISVDGVMVSGSRGFRRDPRLGRLVEESYKPSAHRSASRAEITHRAHVGLKWCSECDEWKMREEFSRDARYKDQKNPHCKECRARHERRMYALLKEAQGQTVRSYTRKEREEIIQQKAS